MRVAGVGPCGGHPVRCGRLLAAVGLDQHRALEPRGIGVDPTLIAGGELLHLEGGGAAQGAGHDMIVSAEVCNAAESRHGLTDQDHQRESCNILRTYYGGN